ncbi:MAG TPA: hypothetical protein VF519_03350 [Mycobacteriales bacterium]|jgi:hypothetical protein
MHEVQYGTTLVVSATHVKVVGGPVRDVAGRLSPGTRLLVAAQKMSHPLRRL